MIPFLKMHGLGNDFIVFDARQTSALCDMVLDSTAARLLSHRQFGIGCDQIMIMRPARGAGDIYLEMLNQDGSHTGACGNGTRCVAHLIMAETGADKVVIETDASLLHASCQGDMIAVDMGPALLAWDDIPLASQADTMALELSPFDEGQAVAVNMGNPHAVIFVDDAESVDVAKRGAALTQCALFPEGANISFASKLDENRFRMVVYERGVGITIACGSGACAVGVAAHRKGLAGRATEIVLDGGSLFIEWLDNGHVIMRGPVATSYEGVLSEQLEQAFLAAQKA